MMWICPFCPRRLQAFHAFPFRQAWVYLARAKLALGDKKEAYRAVQEARTLQFVKRRWPSTPFYPFFEGGVPLLK